MEQETRAKLSRKRTPSECFVKYFILTPFLVQSTNTGSGPGKKGLGNTQSPDDSKKSQEKGVGSGDYIGYDPDAWGRDPDGGKIPPEVRLLHELGHANDADKGLLKHSSEKGANGVPYNEETAIGAENWVRKHYGLKERKTYLVGGRQQPVTPRDPHLYHPPSSQPGSQPSSGPSSQPASGPGM